jgi:pSer/pThr/pTyr-binding forkhead associated (FHA) protein
MHETMLHTGPRLAVVGGPDSGQNYALGQQTRLGRSPDNEIALTDPQVSRYHALIQRQKQEYIISDLGSGNGVYLNGRLVDRATQLKAGDIINLGNTQMRFD